MPVKLTQQSVPGATASDVQPPVPVVQPPLLPQPRPLPRVPPAPPGRDAVVYPYEDGLPMASSPAQEEVMVDTRHGLKSYFAGRLSVYIGMDILVFDRQGDNTSCLAPDVFVAFDTRGTVDKSYRIWEVGKPPDVVWEFGSDSTWKGDAKEKKERYRQWGVSEYWLYAPHSGLHNPRLQGFQLVKGRYRRLLAERRSDGLLAVKSPLLGLEQHFDGQRLRLWDPANREYLRTGAEDATGHRMEREGRRREHKKRLKAEAAEKRQRKGRLQAEAGEERERKGRMKAEAGEEREREGRRRERKKRLKAVAEQKRERERRLESDSRAEAREAALRARIAELEASGAIPRK